jgi:hypothetical protein
MRRAVQYYPMGRSLASDLFATLPPLLAGLDPTQPIAVLGLGGGTCARSLAALYPHDTRPMAGTLGPLDLDR